MAQLFSNNVDTALAAALSDSATSATLADGSGLRSPTGGDYELLTLAAAGNYEIVRITARTGNSITITRAQEGTTARSWLSGTRAFAGVTAGTLSGLGGGLVNNTESTNALALLGTVTDNATGIAIGHEASVTSTGSGSMAIGPSATADGNIALAVGESASATAQEAVAFGRQASASEQYALALGAGAAAGGAYSVTIGAGASTDADDVFVLTGLPTVSKYAYSASVAASTNVAAPAIVTSGVLNLKNTQTYEIPIPTGVTFFPDEVGIIISTADTVTGQPTVRWGINGATEQYVDSAATTGLEAVGDRQRWTSLKTAKGTSTLRFQITTGATGTTLTGRIYWRGFAVEA